MPEKIHVIVPNLHTAFTQLEELNFQHKTSFTIMISKKNDGDKLELTLEVQDDPPVKKKYAFISLYDLNW